MSTWFLCVKCRNAEEVKLNWRQCRENWPADTTRLGNIKLWGRDASEGGTILMGEAAPAGSVGARLEFEMKRMEAEERRAQESQQIIMPFLHILKPPLPYYGPVPPYLSYQDAVAPRPLLHRLCANSARLTGLTRKTCSNYSHWNNVQSKNFYFI